MAFVPVFGKQIHFELLLPGLMSGIKPVLVFLHEGLGSIGQWKTFPEKLCRRLELPGIVFERNGYAKSEVIQHHWNNLYMHWEARDFLPVFLDTVLPGKKFILVGHSDGGSIALLHVSKNETRILGVVSMAAHVMVEEQTVGALKSTVLKYQQGALRKALARYHGDATDLVFTRWAYEWLSEEFFYWNIVAEIKSIKIPLLAIQGDTDAYGSDEQLHKIKAAIPGAQIQVIDNCGHSPHLEKEKETLELVLDFIRSLITNRN